MSSLTARPSDKYTKKRGKGPMSGRHSNMGAIEETSKTKDRLNPTRKDAENQEARYIKEGGALFKLHMVWEQVGPMRVSTQKGKGTEEAKGSVTDLKRRAVFWERELSVQAGAKGGAKKGRAEKKENQGPDSQSRQYLKETRGRQKTISHQRYL